ncbi:hypothetical protein QMZ05_02260 [Bradyrhizobium sp. INPA03-11B]|uniref:hypothetical protein n=1 Tax=Bradyrhizobium sp. INPA03-11B TaxID=418598 RepID=UPI00338F736A
MIAESGAAGQQEPSTLLSQLAYVTPEVVEFVIDAAKSDPDRKDVVVGWGNLLEGYRRRDMPRSALRLFVDVLRAFPGSEEGRKDTGSISCCFLPLTAPSNSSLNPGGRARYLRASAVERWRSGDRDRAGACLVLMADVLSWNTPERDRVISQIFAAWLNPRALREALAVARKLGRSEHHHIRQEDDLPLWAFLQSAKVSGTPPSVAVDTDSLHRHADMVIYFGIAEGEDMRSEGAVRPRNKSTVNGTRVSPTSTRCAHSFRNRI